MPAALDLLNNGSENSKIDRFKALDSSSTIEDIDPRQVFNQAIKDVQVDETRWIENGVIIDANAALSKTESSQERSLAGKTGGKCMDLHKHEYRTARHMALTEKSAMRRQRTAASLFENSAQIVEQSPKRTPVRLMHANTYPQNNEETQIGLIDSIKEMKTQQFKYRG